MSLRTLLLPVLAALCAGALALGCGGSRVAAPKPAANSPPASTSEDAFSVGTCDSAVLASTTAGGIVRSTDGGTTWSLTSRTSVRGFAAIGSTLFSAANSGVLVSHDAGLHWTLVSAPALPSATFWYFAVVGDRIFVNGTFSGVWRSRDLGAHWESASIGLPASTQVGRLAATNGVLIVLANSNVYRSTDGGDSWKQVAPLPTPFPFGLAAGEGSFYIADSFGPVYVSHDDGVTWDRTAGDLPDPVHTLKAIAVGSDLYLPTDHGLFRTVDGGASWEPLAVAGETFTQVNDLTIHAGSLYAATDDRGVQRSDDGGATWTRVHPTGGDLP